MKVLIAEDDSTSREMLIDLLEKNGYDVASADNGAEVLEIMQQPDHPGLVVLDWLMPGISGHEVCRRISHLKEENPLYIIMLAIKGEKRDVVAGLDSGADDYIIKPYDADELRARIDVGRRMMELETKLKNNMEELAVNRELFKSYFENINSIVFKFSVDETISYVSPGWTALLGYDASEVTGRSIREFVHPDDIQSCVNFLKKKLEGESNQNSIEYRVRHRNGLWQWHSSVIAIISGKNGELLSFLGVARDITANVESANRLRESETNFRDFFKFIVDMAIVGSMDGRIIYSNAAVYHTLGYSDSELLQLNMRDLHQVEKREDIWDIFKNMLRGEMESRFMQVVKKDGTFLDVEVRVFLGRWNGEYCIYGIYKNMTNELEARQRFELVFRNNHALMALSLMPDRIFFDVNDAFLRTLGYSRDEIIGATALALNLFPNPAQRSMIIETLEKGGRLDDVELQIRRKDGEIIYGLFSGEVIRISGKDYFFTVMIDITERKRMEYEKRKIEEKYRTLSVAIEQSPFTVVITDLNGNIEFVNPSFFKTTGYAAEEVIGKNPRILKSGDRSDSEYRELWDTILSGREWHGVFRNRKKNGKLYWESAVISPVRDDDGNILHFLAVKEDITGRIAAEEDLKTSLSILNASLESTADGILIVDLEGCVVRWNKKFIQIFNIPEELLSDNNDSHLLNFAVNQIENPEVFTDRVMELYSHPEESGVDIINLIDGRVLERYSLPHKIGNEIVGRVWSFRDITQSKKITDMLIDAKREAEILREEAESSSRAKSEFLASMSHEIRTPMNGVISMTNLLLDSGLTPKQKHYAHIIRSSGESLLSIINDILDFSKIEANKLDLEILDFHLTKTMNDTIELMAANADEKGLDLALWIDENIPQFLRGDPGRLRQVILNLLSNAIKFTAEGKVEVHVILEEEIDDWLRLRFKITDTGIGISKDKQKNVFSPFTQADSSVTRKYGGTGLGLTISKQLAELMGGAIGVESEEWKGSTFWFTAIFEKQHGVGTSDRQDAGREIQFNSSAMHKKNVRILLAEDNYTNQIVAVEMLKKIGYYGVDITANGYESLTALRSIPYDLVLMDCHMPELDGFEATRQIRSTQSGVLNHNIPVIAMTALAMRGDRDQALEAGMDDYLIKPVEIQDLSKMLEKWLSKTVINTAEEYNGNNIDDKPDLPGNENGETSARIFNREAFVARLMGDENLAGKISRAFLGDMPIQMEKLGSAINASDCIAASRQAHKIRGASANVGGETMRDIAAAMEIAGASCDLESLKALFPELQGQYDLLREKIEIV